MSPRAVPSRRLTLIIPLLLVGCAPSISPLYRDFEDDAAPEARVDPVVVERVRRALDAAGWDPVPGAVPTVVATAPRTFRNWGLYRVEVELEVTPLAGDWARVLISPYRRFFTGSRRKIPYLKKSLAGDLLGDLAVAMKEEGLLLAGTAEQRDRASGAR